MQKHQNRLGKIQFSDGNQGVNITSTHSVEPVIRLQATLDTTADQFGNGTSEINSKNSEPFDCPFADTALMRAKRQRRRYPDHTRMPLHTTIDEIPKDTFKLVGTYPAPPALAQGQLYDVVILDCQLCDLSLAFALACDFRLSTQNTCDPCV